MKKKLLATLLSLALLVPCFIGTSSFKSKETNAATTEQKIALSWSSSILTGYEGTASGGGNNSPDKLVDGKKGTSNYTKWCSLGDSNSFAAIFTASNRVILQKYIITTADDASSSPHRNWKQWKIYGSDSTSGEWTKLVEHQGGGLPNTNHTSTTYTDGITIVEKSFKYYKVTFSVVNFNAEGRQQMEELELYGTPIYSITYKDGDTTLNGLTPTEYIEGKGASSLPTPSAKQHMTFDGWYDAKTGGNKITSISSSATGDKTLYAHYTPVNYTLTAYANNGSISSTTGWTGTGSSATKSVAYDSGYGTFPTVSRTGYTLKGWYTASSGGTEVTSSTKMTSSSGSTIYAQWTANTYTVVYNGNNNTGGSMSSSSHTYDSSKNLTSNGFTRTGYSFAGWATSSDGEVVYSNGQSVKNLTSTNNGTVNLYAKWNANSYTITYKDKGNSDFSGTHESGYPTTHTYASSTTLMSATKTGFIFEGWYDSQDCSGSPVTSLGATAYTADITLYGKWSVDPAYKPTAVSQIGGFTYVEGTKRQVVGFGFQVDSNVYNLLVNDSDFGVIAYKSGSSEVEYSKGNIADLITNEGRFYLSLTFNDITPVTYYAKAFVKINGNYIYSDLVSASGNLVGQEYIL